MLYRGILLYPAQNIFERNRGFMATTGDHAQIVQVFKEFFVFFDRENYRFALAIFDDVFRRGFARFHGNACTTGGRMSQLTNSRRDSRADLKP